MNNATQNPSPEQSPKRVACPSWCVRHYGLDEGHRDEAVTHLGPDREVAGFRVRLERFELVSVGRPGAVYVRLDDREMTVAEAAVLGALLSTTAADVQMWADEEAVIVTLDLPEGQDYVLFADSNVIGLASRLDDAGRERALVEAGVR